MSRQKGIPSRYRFRIGQRVEYELPSEPMVGVVAEHLPAGDRVRFKSGIDLTVPVEQLRKVEKGHSCWGPVHCDGECDNPHAGKNTDANTVRLRPRRTQIPDNACSAGGTAGGNTSWSN